MWSSIHNTRLKDPKGEATKFAEEAEKLLVRYKNVLPKKHLCSNTRHKRKFYGGKVKALKDAKRGKIAVLVF